MAALSLLMFAPSAHAGELWRVHELTLTSSYRYTNPFLDVSVTATFTGPGGTQITRAAFWDGGNTWKIRFAPTKVGTWSYVTTASDLNNGGLHNQTGMVNATAYSGSYPIYQHGFLKPGQNGHYLVYADGTPFFWLGDDETIFDALRLNESNKTTPCTLNWNPPIDPANTCSQYRGIINRRVNQGYTLVNHSFLHHYGFSYWATGMVGSKINPDYFRNAIDPKIQFAADNGLVIALGVGFHCDVTDSTLGGTGMQRFAKYIVARYGAYPLVWPIVEPDLPTSNCSGSPPADTLVTRWNTVAQDIDIADSYSHPQGVWYWATSGGGLPTTYQNESWLDLTIFQTGHNGFQPSGNIGWYFSTYPRPVVDAGGNLFEQIHSWITPYIVRKAAYRTIQAGSFGQGYGAHGIWNATWDPANVLCCPQWYQPGISWYDSIDYLGGAQMTHLKTFYASLDWFNLRPRQNGSGWATWALSLADANMPLEKASEGGHQATVYFPSEYNTSGNPGTLNNLTSAGSYTAKWFNPQTGAYSTISASVTPSGGSWAIPQKPDSNDWLLQVTSNDGPNLASNKTYSSSTSWDATRTAPKGFDAEISNPSNWTAASGAGAGYGYNNSWLEVDFGVPRTFNKVYIAESGNQTSGFRIEYWNGSSWITAHTGTTIGASMVRVPFTFSPVTGTKARIVFTAGTNVPIIYEAEFYNASGGSGLTVPNSSFETPAQAPNGYTYQPAARELDVRVEHGNSGERQPVDRRWVERARRDTGRLPAKR